MMELSQSSLYYDPKISRAEKEEQDADLRGAIITDAKFDDAELSDARLEEVDLSSANLRYAKGLDPN